MRTLAIALAAFLAIGAGEPSPGRPAPNASAWLQERLDRILARTGRAPGDVKAVIADTTDMPWVHPTGSLQFPRALLVMAPSPEAVDGMLAMLLSYEREDPADARRADASTGFALRGGASDASGLGGQRDGAAIQGGSGRGSEPEGSAQLRRAQAWQGARWNGQIGNCASVQIDFLRATGKEARIMLDGRASVWPGSPFSRKVIEYLGAQAYPAEQRCRTSRDPDFALIQQTLQSPAGQIEPAD